MQYASLERPFLSVQATRGFIIGVISSGTACICYRFYWWPIRMPFIESVCHLGLCGFLHNFEASETGIADNRIFLWKARSLVWTVLKCSSGQSTNDQKQSKWKPGKALQLSRPVLEHPGTRVHHSQPHITTLIAEPTLVQSSHSTYHIKQTSHGTCHCCPQNFSVALQISLSTLWLTIFEHSSFSQNRPNV